MVLQPARQSVRRPEGIAELTRHWCVALNRMQKVKDFRPATRLEVADFVQRHDSVDRGGAAAKPARRVTRKESAPDAASANGVRYKLRELGSRYFGMSQRALAALRSRPRSGLPKRRHVAIWQPNTATGHVRSARIRGYEHGR
jgi:hypothetical protein